MLDILLGGLKVAGATGAFAASSLTAASLAWVGGTALGMMSKLLDMSMYALVARFDTVIYGALSPIINQLWTAFRDISNILIIGMFTFIAISMILGSQSFGSKKLIARVLIIAVLINFSLLFGRVIIESSNFVARQFYCSMIAGTGSEVCSSGSTGALNLAAVGNAETGIGLEFMKFLGARGFVETRATADKIFNDSGGNALTGRLYSILYGVAAMLLMLAAAAVFAYIVFLLVARAILFIFLLVMSAPAFAAYLIPKYGEMYWSMWWNALLRNAIFGPLLMMLLWATFLISRGLSDSVTGTHGGSFDMLFSNQASGSGYLALLVFAIILGMLFAAARFAQSFSRSIAGFDMTSAMTSAPFAAFSRYGIAPLMRNMPVFGGRGAARRALDIGDEISAEKKAKALAPRDTYDNSKLAKLIKEQGEAESKSKRTFDPLNTTGGQFLAKQLNTPSFLTGKTKTNFAETAKDRADAAAKGAAGTALSKNDADEAAAKHYEDQKKVVDEQRRASSDLVKAAESLANSTKKSEGVEGEIAAGQAELKAARENQAKIHEEAEKKLKQPGLTDDQRKEIASSRDASLDEQAQRIRNANKVVLDMQKRAAVIDKDSGVHDARENLRKAEAASNALGKQQREKAKDILENDAEEVGKLSEKILSRSLAGAFSKIVEMTPDDVTTRMARDLAKKKIKAKGAKARRETDDAILKDANEAEDKH